MGNNDDDNNYTSEALACLVAPRSFGEGVGGEESPFLYPLYTPFFYPAPFHVAYYEVLTTFAMGEIQKANDHHATPTRKELRELPDVCLLLS